MQMHIVKHALIKMQDESLGSRSTDRKGCAWKQEETDDRRCLLSVIQTIKTHWKGFVNFVQFAS
jgi:hypothetical protein